MTTSRGYLKDSGGSKRLRFVKSGYDAADETVPPNQVIFDSKNLATLSILETGSFTWTNVLGTTGLQQVQSWSYGFIPLCIFQWEDANNGLLRGAFTSSASPTTMTIIQVDLTGIYVQGYFQTISNQAFAKLHWTAFGIDARDGA